MADAIPNLWSENISVNALTPVAILRSQAGLLRQLTNGLIEAEVDTDQVNFNNEIKLTRHHLDLVATALDRARYRILTASHQQELVYPVEIEADLYKPGEYDDPEEWSPPEAGSEIEFINHLAEILKSKYVVSTINSLIARSNEARANATNEGAPQEPKSPTKSPGRGKRPPV